MRKLMYIFLMMIIISMSVIPVSAQDAGIDRIHISVKALDDDTLEITETIVTTPSLGNSFTRVIPYHTSDKIDVNGTRYIWNKRFQIKDLSVMDEKGNACEVKANMSGTERVYSISPPIYIAESSRFTLRYTYQLGPNETRNPARLIHTLVSAGNLQIGAVTFDLTLPQELPEELDFSVYRELGGETWFGRDGERLLGGCTDLRPGDALKFRVDLGTEYFDIVNNNEEKSYTGQTLAIFAVVGVLLYVFYRLWGKERPLVPTVEFYPPDEMTPAEVGYVIDGKVDKRDLVALLIYWADKGYLAIDDTGDGVRGFSVRKLRDIPEDGDIKEYEKLMFGLLFDKRDTVGSDALEREFPSILARTEYSLVRGFHQGERVFAWSAGLSKFLACFFAGGASALLFVFGYIKLMWGTQLVEQKELFFGSGNNVLRQLMANDMVALMMGLSAFVAGFGVTSLFSVAAKNILIKRGEFNFKSVVNVVLYAIIAGGVGFLTGLFAEAIAFSVLMMWASNICALSNRRSDYGHDMAGRLLGFKAFLEAAENDRLRVLAEEDHEYFYHTLSYAYVFGYTDNWAGKFDGLTIERKENNGDGLLAMAEGLEKLAIGNY